MIYISLSTYLSGNKIIVRIQSSNNPILQWEDILWTP